MSGWPPDRGVGQKLYCAFRKIFWLHFAWEILSTQSNLKDKTKMKYIADLVWPINTPNNRVNTPLGAIDPTYAIFLEW